MKRLSIICLAILFLASSVLVGKGFDGRPITNNVWMPTGYTIDKGEFLLGLGPIAFGISDRVQVGTNVLLFLFQDYNANLKISFVKDAKKALAAGFKFHRFDLDVYGIDTEFNSFSPFAAFSTKVSRNTSLHLGGQYSYFSSKVEIEDAKVESTSEGTSAYLGIEHSFSYKTKFLAEVGYDFTFKGFRVGGAVLFGWEKFRLKLGVNYFSPEDSQGFIFPVISLWWRFPG